MGVGMRPFSALLIAAWLVGCGSDDASRSPGNITDNTGGGGGGSSSNCIDEDGDGFGSGCESGSDCDDADASVASTCGSTICKDGAYKDCKVILGKQGDVENCFEGIQFCINGVWGPCDDPPEGWTAGGGSAVGTGGSG